MAFCGQVSGENFVIYDDRRRYAVVHLRLKECFYINESEFKQLERSVPVKTDSFEQLWKVYFEHTDIRSGSIHNVSAIFVQSGIGRIWWNLPDFERNKLLRLHCGV